MHLWSVREHTKDAQGRLIASGNRVRVLGEDGHPEGTVVRVLDDYGLVTVAFEQKTSKVERMYRTTQVEVL